MVVVANAECMRSVNVIRRMVSVMRSISGVISANLMIESF